MKIYEQCKVIKQNIKILSYAYVFTADFEISLTDLSFKFTLSTNIFVRYD